MPDLQQTPDSAAKTIVKILEKNPDGGDPISYMFHFHTSEAKTEATAIKGLLSGLMTSLKNNDPSIPKPTQGTPGGTPAPSGQPNGGSGSGSMAFASAVNSNAGAVRWFDDSQLKNDIELQQSLMKTDRSLHRTYMEAMETKPSTISSSAFNSQFWSTRTNLLRAHAIESNQKKGPYNVLSILRPRQGEDNSLKINISVEQVQMIFAQHPLVKRIYNENVPKLSEGQFWSRFFLSRLCKQLRGERVTDNDPPDPLFDKFDPSENTQGIQSKIMAQSVPNFIDLEANEENQGGFKSGNKKDVEMRPRATIPVVKTLNSLSEKIMANVAPSDMNLDEEAWNHQLALRDLQGPAKEHRIMLNVKEQNKFFSKRDAAPSANAKIFAKQKPEDVLFGINADLETLQDDSAGRIDLHASIGFNEESDSDDDDEDTTKKAHVGSRSILQKSDKQIMHGIQQQRSQKYGHPSDTTTPMGLSQSLANQVALTHATTIEFLHQFWNAFLSGDPDRAGEIQYLAESLGKSVERVEKVAEDADKEREEAIKRQKQEIRRHYEATKEKRKLNVKGGRDAVNKLMQPTLDAIKKAQEDYARALAAEGIKVSTES